MAEKWTDEQLKAMELDDSCTDILVSASAGSGKTAVLVERIIRMLADEKDPVDLDRILVVTFTRAAAGEMKGKIQKALADRIASEDTPEELRERLRRQEIMVPHARIMTIDGFCRELIAENFSALDIDPGFDIGSEDDLRLLKSDIAGSILEEHYGGDDEAFMRLSEMYRGNRTGSGSLEETMLAIYNAASVKPEPVKWMESLKEGLPSDGDPDNIPAVKYITEKMTDRIKGLVRELEEIEAETQAYPGLGFLAEYAEGLAALLGQAASQSTFSELCSYFPMNPESVPMKHGKTETEKNAEKGIKKRLRSVRDFISKRIDPMFIGQGAGTERKAVMLFAGAAGTFVDLAIEFSRRFAEAKKERNILDFGDLEHYALELLTYNDNGVRKKTDKAVELSEGFREIMIDEYQDTNELQELILSALKSEGPNHNRMFMVGDVKQSIYSFRNAEPGIFMDKYRSFTRNEGPCMKVDLQANFRSADCVIDPVNAIFESIMTAETGEVDYDSHQKLVRRRENCPPDNGRAVVIRIRPAADDDLSKAERQALEIGREIKRITDTENGIMIYDKDGDIFRRAELSDIGILMRSLAGRKGEDTANKLAELGIPAEVDSKTGFLESFEVNLMLSLLTLMDNSDQDIPLASVMLSQAGGFTDSDLLIIKHSSEKKSLYGCCLEAAERDTDLGRRVSAFTLKLKELRQVRALYPLHEYIELLAESFDVREFTAAMPGGARRLSNLDLLITKAAEYEKGTYRGLFNFLRYIKRLKEDESVEMGESIASSDSKSVRITTIHKSKGLEYPIVFVADMQKGFNTSDSKGNMIIDGRFGIALKTYDPDERTMTDNIVKRALAERIKDKNINEEMRILYVALTRARDRLYITGICGDSDTGSKSGSPLWEETSEGEISTEYLKNHPNYLDWVMPVAKRFEGSLFEIRDIDADMADTGDTAQEETCGITPSDVFGTDPDKVYDEELLRNMRERGAGYRFTADTTLPVKFSVSDLKHGAAVDDEEEPAAMLPSVHAEAGSGEASLLGTAVHKIFEVMDPGRRYDEDDIRLLADELAEKGLIAPAVREKIDPGFFMGLHEKDIFRRMKKGYEEGTLKREQQFVISVPAKDVYTDMDSSEYVLIQGIIDAYFIEDGQAVIVDYKTDRLKPGTEEKVLKERYGIQMAYYIKALEMSLDIPVKEAVLYSVRNKKEVHILPEEVRS